MTTDEKLDLVLEYLFTKHMYEFHSKIFEKELINYKDRKENDVQIASDNAIKASENLNRAVLKINNILASKNDK